jgi:hypothetical protein
VTLPTSDAQSSRFLPRRPQQMHTAPPTHSITPLPSSTPRSTPPLSMSDAGFSDEIAQERALDFASHSWDLATGGLKTLTAKRELPTLLERRPTEKLQDTSSVPRSYMFMLVILVCLVLMLISGGIVLFVMLQP